MNLLLRAAPVVLAATVALPAFAKATVDLSKGKREVEFHAVGNPSFLKINGEDEAGDGLSGSMEKDGDKVSGKAVFKMANFKTGMSLRDSHMKEKYLHVDKYPTAELTITKLPWGKADKGDFEAKGPFEGQLTLHGVTKPVVGEAKVERDGDDLEAKVTFKIKLTDYGIEIPSFQGITVAADVDVEIALDTPVKST